MSVWGKHSSLAFRIRNSNWDENAFIPLTSFVQLAQTYYLYPKMSVKSKHSSLVFRIHNSNRDETV